MAWHTSNTMQIWIFAVDRGLAVFLRSPLNHGFIYDMGSCSDFDPWDFVVKKLVPKLTPYKDSEGRSHQIAQAVLSHPHSDHISECELLTRKDLYPAYLTCPHDKTAEEKLNWNRVKNPGNNAESLNAMYRSLYAKRQPPLRTVPYDSSMAVPGPMEGT